MRTTLLYLLFIVSLVLFLAGPAQAQKGKIDIGAKAGVLVSSLHGTDLKKYFDWQTTATGSFGIQYYLTDVLTVSTNISYESKGCKGVDMKLFDIEGKSMGSHYSFKYTYDFVTVPLLFGYSSPQSGFFVNAGPYLGYLLSYRETYGSHTLTRTSDMNNIELGFSLGIGISFPIYDKLFLTAELRNNMGLTNLVKGSNTYQDATIRPAFVINEATTNATGLLLGFRYEL